MSERVTAAVTRASRSEAATFSEELSALEDVADRVRLIRDRYAKQAILTTSFGAQAAVMLHLFKQHAPEIPIVFIDTGYLFFETYQFAEQLIKKWDLNVHVYQARLSAARQEALYGKLWEQGDAGRQKFALINKIEPMNRAIEELKVTVWISGLRRAQSESRLQRAMAEQQKAIMKVYPIIDWSDDDVARYLIEHALPQNPLVYQGYVSIGDWHSTKPLGEGMTAEQTRFEGHQRECGLHVPSANQDFQI